MLPEFYILSIYSCVVPVEAYIVRGGRHQWDSPSYINFPFDKAPSKVEHK